MMEKSSRLKISKTRKRLFKEGKLKTWNKGIPRTKKEKENIGRAIKKSKENGKGRAVWTNEMRKKMGKKRIGKNNPFYGKNHSEKTKEYLRKKLKGSNKGFKNGMYGKKPSNAYPAGKNHPFFNDWSSKEPYGIEFFDKRQEIILRDKMCQLCFKSIKDNYGIHHIDYNKKNNENKNLILLCSSCHSQTNHNRKFWMDLFQSRQKTYILNSLNYNSFINRIKDVGGIK